VLFKEAWTENICQTEEDIFLQLRNNDRTMSMDNSAPVIVAPSGTDASSS